MSEGLQSLESLKTSARRRAAALGFLFSPLNPKNPKPYTLEAMGDDQRTNDKTRADVLPTPRGFAPTFYSSLQGLGHRFRLNRSG